MYILLSGQISIMATGLRGSKCVGSLGPGGTYGEIELLTGEPYSTSAVAVNPAVVVSIDGETFASTLGPTYGKELLQRARFLQTTTPFRSWTVALLVDLATFTQCTTTIRGKRISDAAQLREEKTIYFVVDGTVNVESHDEGGEGASTMLQSAGSFWGLSCIFPELEEGNTVVTAHSSHVELLTIDSKTLREKVDEQTLRHFAEIAGFALERSKHRSQRVARPGSASSFSDERLSTGTSAASQLAAMPGEADSIGGHGASETDAAWTSHGAMQPKDDLVSRVIERAAAALPREELARTPSGWLPLRVDEQPRPSLRRVWAAKDAAQGIAFHMDELISLLDTNELLLAQLSGSSCVAILNALGAVNKILDATGLWRGHSSAQDARRQLEAEAELCRLTGQEMDTNMGRLQLEVLLKLTAARIAHMVENSNAGYRVDIVEDNLESVHSRIDECLECTHEQLLDSGTGIGHGIDSQQSADTSKSEGGDSHGSPQDDNEDYSQSLSSTLPQGDVADVRDDDDEGLGESGTVWIGGKKVKFASGRWVWTSKSGKSVFPFAEEENEAIEVGFSRWTEGSGSRTVSLELHFIDFEQMRQVRADSHEHWRDVKRCRAGIDRFEPS